MNAKDLNGVIENQDWDLNLHLAPSHTLTRHTPRTFKSGKGQHGCDCASVQRNRASENLALKATTTFKTSNTWLRRPGPEQFAACEGPLV